MIFRKYISVAHRALPRNALDTPECSIRFLPIKSKMMDMSSTRAREVIQLALPQEQLLRRLQQLILSPDILLELIAREW